ncbi:hypothetical protein KC960_04780 [Candidatus Saccharibacteria bacterium]|nr:hypothetical protein [Candidatus Saccharibacteria bacterium]
MVVLYRIHGDNIIECEVAIEIITEAIAESKGLEYSINLENSSLSTPKYKVIFSEGSSLLFELFPGHNRWDNSLSEYLTKMGAPLRESVDAFVTRVDNAKEIPVAAFEFCNALPAGNNAWQRAGRAISMVEAGIPYFYFAEIGGQELDANRKIKAPRFPNPIVPYSYLTLSSAATKKCTTVYLPSRSISEETYKEFEDAFANREYTHAIASIFTESETENQDLEESKNKSAQFVLDLAERRRRSDTHSIDTWNILVENAQKGRPISEVIIKDNLNWSKKIAIKANKTLSRLIADLQKLDVAAIGSRDMPFCIVDAKKRSKLSQLIDNNYGESVSEDFKSWIKNGEKSLVIVFIAGFKPRGDDSRPDRGLVPLASMIFANDDIDILSVVYGPAKERTWSELFDSPMSLASNNGLWEAIIGLGDGLLIDSVTFDATKQNRDLLTPLSAHTTEKVDLAKFSNIPRYGEHDVDSALHLLFSNTTNEEVFESLCNPPGGDWSGVSFLDQEGATNRWTSLPRVTGVDGKRPDHIIQFLGDVKFFLSIESKDLLRNLEEKIGPRLNYYTKELLISGKAQSRKLKDSLLWTQNIDEDFLNKALNEYSFYSGAAIMGRADEAILASKKSFADVVFSIDFSSKENIIYVIVNNEKIRRPLIDFLDSQQTKTKILNSKLIVLN